MKMKRHQNIRIIATAEHQQMKKLQKRKIIHALLGVKLKVQMVQTP